MLSSANSFYVIIFALVVSLFQIDLNPSFIEGTLVKTPQGLIPVEYLKVGDNVISCELNADAKEEFCKTVAVKEIITHVVSTMVCIHIDNGLVYASSDQLFFDSIANQWLAAQLLTENSVFINSKLECFNCVKIESVHKECLVYDVTLEEPHLLFITEQEILAHNAIPVVVLPIAVKTIPIVVKVACVAAGAIGLYKLLGGKSKKNHSSHQQNQPDREPENNPNNRPHWIPHKHKHFPNKNMSWEKIIKETVNGPAKYKHDVNIKELEYKAWEQGTPVTNGRPWKVFKANRIIGAKEGIETPYLRIEISSNTIHGHPITPAEYIRYLK